MERLLKDSTAADATLALAAQLVAVEEPSAVSTAMRDRVWQSLDAPKRKIGRQIRFMPLMVAIVLLAMVSTASAMWSRQAIVPLWRRLLVSSATATARPKSEPAISAPQAVPVSQLPLAPPSTTEPAPLRVAAASPIRKPPLRRKPELKQVAAEQPLVEERSEATLVTQAFTALRHEHDAARVQVLLDQYAREFPKGELSEDVLALQIEVAVAQNQTALATALAGKYKQRYPQGNFIKTIEKLRR